MTVSDLIMELASMPQELEVIYEHTMPEDEGFRMVVVTNLEVIDTDNNKFVLLNANQLEGIGEEFNDDEL
jgi:hypothetical protein